MLECLLKLFLKSGDVIEIQDSEIPGKQYTIAYISQSGTSIVLTETFFAAANKAGPNKRIVKILQNPIIVNRAGDGNSVPEVQKLTIQASDQLSPNPNGGYYKIGWTHKGLFQETSWCLPLDASAQVFQTALNS